MPDAPHSLKVAVGHRNNCVEFAIDTPAGMMRCELPPEEAIRLARMLSDAARAARPPIILSS